MQISLENEQILIKDKDGKVKSTELTKDYIRDNIGSNSEFPTIMLFSPIKDREWILPEFLTKIEQSDYPKDKIRCVFLINDCKDSSEHILRQWKHSREKLYAGIDIIVYNINAPVDKRNKRKFVSYYCYFATLRNHGLHQLKDEDFIFSVDSDILIRPDTIKKLVSHRKDIVASILPNNASKTAWNILQWSNEITASHIRDVPKNQLIKVGFTGACYLIDRRVIKSGVRYGYHMQGEDGYFCQMALKKGFEIWADTSLIQDHKLRIKDY